MAGAVQHALLAGPRPPLHAGTAALPSRTAKAAKLPLFQNRRSIPRRQGITLAGRMSAPSLHLLFSTCPDADSADRIAHALLEERLAACVTQLPGAQSLYRWSGAIERSTEVQLLIKTWDDRLPDAIARLQALHPYELPEAVAVQASAGLPAYLDWVRAETRKES